MKKIHGFIGLLATAILMFSCATTQKVESDEKARPEPTFTKDYNILRYRMYSAGDFINNKYRSNFEFVPKDEVYDSMEGFNGRTGAFTIDGTKLYLGLVGEKNYIVLADDSGNIYFNTGNHVDEWSGFVFGGNGNYVGIGYVFEAEINSKKYVLAIATGMDDFKMWIEDSVPTDKAETVTDSQGIKNYDDIDVAEGIYKPGYKRLWGKAAPEYQNYYDLKNYIIYKYNYNGVDFVIGGRNDLKNYVLTLDGKPLEPASKSYFKIMSGNKDNRNFDLGLCYEGKVKIGDKSVTMAVLLWEGDIRVFVKE